MTKNKSQTADFWLRVQGLCKKHHITQKELSQDVGLSPNSVTVSITTNGEPSLFTAAAIADRLGTTLQYLVKGDTSSEGKCQEIADRVLVKTRPIIEQLEQVLLTNIELAVKSSV